MTDKTFKAKVMSMALAAGTALSMAGVAQAEDPVEEAIDYRSSVMTVMRWNVGPMGDMVKGKKPFDAAKFANHAQDLARTATLDILAGFPEGSDLGETDARPEIWMSWDDFKGKLEALRTESAKLAEVAASGDEAAMKKQFGATAKTCKSCHDDFKN